MAPLRVAQETGTHRPAHVPWGCPPTHPHAGRRSQLGAGTAEGLHGPAAWGTPGACLSPGTCRGLVPWSWGGQQLQGQLMPLARGMAQQPTGTAITASTQSQASLGGHVTGLPRHLWLWVHGGGPTTRPCPCPPQHHAPLQDSPRHPSAPHSPSPPMVAPSSSAGAQPEAGGHTGSWPHSATVMNLPERQRSAGLGPHIPGLWPSEAGSRTPALGGRAQPWPWVGRASARMGE